jgi:D-specific alpha-keto acid dehydrogenase
MEYLKNNQILDLFVYDCDDDERRLFQEYGKAYELNIKVVKEALTIQTASLAAGCSRVSVSHRTPVSAEILSIWKRSGVRYVSTRSVGCNHIDLEAARKLGVAVDTVEYSPESVAEHTVMLMFMALREIKAQLKRVEEQDFSLSPYRSPELRDMTVGVVGTGKIGRTVIAYLKSFGCRVLVYDLYHSTDEEYVTYETLLRKSDIITYHIPLTSETQHMLDVKSIRYLKDGCYIINTARGALIESKALLKALESGKVAGAALDVVENDEAYFYRNCKAHVIDRNIERLCGMSNVIITPHTAFHTDHALHDTVENTIKKSLRFERKTEKWIS